MENAIVVPSRAKKRCILVRHDKRLGKKGPCHQNSDRDLDPAA